MRSYISLALAITPSGLGSHCKHVGIPAKCDIFITSMAMVPARVPRPMVYMFKGLKRPRPAGP